MDGVDLVIRSGETVGLVGESGCGKSTLGRATLQLNRPTAGSVQFQGIDLGKLSSTEMRRMRRRMQMILQDPYASLDPRMTANDIVGEALEIHDIGRGRARVERISKLLELVGMSPALGRRYPHEFSGGQRQRIGVARALAVDPEFIVADEPISALDVSIQAQLVNLLEELQEELGLTYLFIAHDLAVVAHIANRVGVMYLGVIVELADRAQLYAQPLHPYTQALLSAVPIPDPEIESRRKRIVLTGDIASPVDPPSGCRFRTRCFLRERLGDPEVARPSNHRWRSTVRAIGWHATSPRRLPPTSPMSWAPERRPSARCGAPSFPPSWRPREAPNGSRTGGVGRALGRFRTHGRVKGRTCDIGRVLDGAVFASVVMRTGIRDSVHWPSRSCLVSVEVRVTMLLERFYINGGWTEPVGTETVDVVNPATEEVIAQVRLGTAADVDAAVSAAKDAFPAWSRSTVEERADFLERIAAGLEARTEEISETVSREMGMPLTISKAVQVGLPQQTFMSYAGIARSYAFERREGDNRIIREPIGVCGIITPWNVPLHQVAGKVAPAIAAGCTMVLKPSEVAPLNAYLLAEIIHEVGLPAGVFNLVNGTGPDVGEALASHPDVDMVSFTGSTRAGRRVAELASRTVKRVTQELGGKSPNIILDDADLEEAIPAGVLGCFMNAGQACSAPTRMLVPRAMLPQVERLAKESSGRMPSR